MSAERGKLSDVSGLQRDLNEIALIEELEKEGIHAHSLLKADSQVPDAPLLETIDKAIHEATETSSKPIFIQENRIITRRRSRSLTQNLIRRHR